MHAKTAMPILTSVPNIIKTIRIMKKTPPTPDPPLLKQNGLVNRQFFHNSREPHNFSVMNPNGTPKEGRVAT